MSYLKWILMNVFLVFIIFLLIRPVSAGVYDVDFQSSNLPIVVIDTHDQEIPYDDPRIVADMGIIFNGNGVRSNITDPFNNYNGKVSMEIRGQSSAGWVKKSYSVETQKADGSNNNVSLLGLPSENDWILHAPYYDRSLMRNTLTHHLYREMGWYSSRTKYCELVLNGIYQGIYILMEKIKRDGDRVDISKLTPDEISGDDLTGGYIVRIDKDADTEAGFTSRYSSPPGDTHYLKYQYYDPDGDELVTEQKDYIRNYVNLFETVMHYEMGQDPLNGYAKYLNVASFVDNFIINELSRNVDAYRLSTYFYKDKDSKGGKLTAGPLWDFNFSYGNVGYYESEKIEGWQIDYFLENSYFNSSDGFHAPFWWRQLLDDPAFQQKIYDRWLDLRQSLLSEANLYDFIDTIRTLLGESKDRNFEIWIGPGDPKTPGDGWFPPDYPISNLETYDDEINYLKSWLNQRIAWMDEAISLFTAIHTEEVTPPGKFAIANVYPNPFNGAATVDLLSDRNQHVRLRLYDAAGKLISTVLDQNLTAGNTRLSLNFNHLASGIYLLRMDGAYVVSQRKIVLLK